MSGLAVPAAAVPNFLDLDKKVQTSIDPPRDCAKVLVGSVVEYCYTITNTSMFSTATNLMVVDDQYGVIAPPPSTLDPGQPVQFKVQQTINFEITNTATATATLIDPPMQMTDTSTASVWVVPQITLEKTVDLDADCVGGSPMVDIVDFPPVNVTYCYKVTNPASPKSITYTMHSLEDEVLGMITMIPVNPPCTLAPGQMCVVSQTVMISESIKNTATWTEVSDTVPLPCGPFTTTITNSAMSMAMITLTTPTDTPTETPTVTPTSTPTNTPTNTPSRTPSGTPTDTPTSGPTPTSTNTPVPEGGACAETADCEEGLFCVDLVCTSAVAPAPAASRGGLLVMIGLLLMIGTIAVWRLRRES